MNARHWADAHQYCLVLGFFPEVGRGTVGVGVGGWVWHTVGL